MAKSELIENLKEFFVLTKDLQNKVSALNTVHVANVELKSQIDQLSSKWFNEYAEELVQFSLDKDTLGKYSKAFKGLLKLSGNNNRKTSYLSQFDMICKSFREDIIITLQTNTSDPDTFGEDGFDSEVSSILDQILDKDENEYLREALGCWKNCFFKASIVLVWCAAAYSVRYRSPIPL